MRQEFATARPHAYRRVGAAPLAHCEIDRPPCGVEGLGHGGVAGDRVADERFWDLGTTQVAHHMAHHLMMWTYAAIVASSLAPEHARYNCRT